MVGGKRTEYFVTGTNYVKFKFQHPLIFIGGQPCSFVHIVPVDAFGPQQTIWICKAQYIYYQVFTEKCKPFV